MQVVVVVVVSLSHIAGPLQLPLQHLSLFGVVMSVLSPDIQERAPPPLDQSGGMSMADLE